MLPAKLKKKRLTQKSFYKKINLIFQHLNQLYKKNESIKILTFIMHSSLSLLLIVKFGQISPWLSLL